MKICLVSSYPPNRGSLSEYSYKMLEELVKKREISSIIVLANEHEDAPAVEKEGKITVVRCWKSNSTLSIFNILAEVVKHRPSLVHFNLHLMSWGRTRINNFVGGMMPLAVKMLGYPVVVSLHNIGETIRLKEIKGISPSRLNMLGLRVVTKLLLSVDRVSVTLGHYVSILRERYRAENVVHIPHGSFDIKAKRTYTGGKTILAFGHFSEYKNLPMLIEAFQEIREKDGEVRLIIAGASHPNFLGYIEDVKKRFREVPNITFTGYVPQDRLHDLFMSSTVVVLPYLTSTGCSGVFHLACGFAKPVVMSDLPDFRKMLEEEGIVANKTLHSSLYDGLVNDPYKSMYGDAVDPVDQVALVSVNEYGSLKNAVEELIYNEFLQRELGERNLNLARRYSLHDICLRYLDLYGDVLTERRRGYSN